MGIRAWGFFVLLGVQTACYSAILGHDHRVDWFEETSVKLRALGRGTAVLLSRRAEVLRKIDGGYAFSSAVRTLRESDGVCAQARFSEQPAPGNCTGFLVGADLVLTANHCLVKGCDDLEFLFDFLVEKPGAYVRKFPETSRYRCQEVVDRNEAADWALIRLDRKTAGRPFFTLNRKKRRHWELAS